ncbi:response regulator [Deinococcus oregonensis]|uniref:Response regulator n=1 Tax=Deinococcus oregonensis TaxID=1805970 RepID=A0ABV6B050_9DEIO
MTQVLIVDDSLSVRKALELLLKPFPYTVRMAKSGEAALAEFARERADLVIMDVLMPGLSGFEVCTQLRAGVMPPAIVLMSGIVTDTEQATARDIGALALVKKPFRAEDLLPLVHAALVPPASAASIQAAEDDHPALTAILEALIEKPGVLGASVINLAGQVVMTKGKVTDEPAVVAQYYRFFASAAGVFGERQGDAWQGSLMEFGQRVLMLSPLGLGHTLVLTLRDLSSANVVKYILKTQRPQVERALGYGPSLFA